MSVTSLITKKPLLPVVTIKKNDASLYTWNPFVGTFDFRVTRLTASPPSDNQGGRFSIKITFDDGSNSGMNTILSNIEEGNEITFWVGKSDASKQKIFLGVIESIDDDERNKNFMNITITGPDFGSDILKHRVITNQWVQKRNADGVLDTADNAVTIKQIVLDMLTLDQSYPTANITAEDQGISVSAANIEGGDIRLSVFNANYEFLDDKLQEIDAIGGTIHYVTPEKVFHMTYPTSSTSSLPANILLVDSITDSVGLTWTSGKIGLIENVRLKRTLENHNRRIYGLGGENIAVDKSSETDAGSTTLETEHYAQRFTPDFVRLSKIHVKLSKVGTPANDFVLELREDINNTPTGEVLRTINKDKSFLNGSGTTAVWSPFEINEELNTTKNYWIVIRKTGADSSNTFRWHRDNVDNNPSTSAKSTDDVTWALTGTPNRYKYAFRTFRGTDVFSVLEQNGVIVSTDKHLHEDTVRKADITETELMNKLLKQQTETAFKRKEILRCRVYAPDTLLTTGQKVHVRKMASGYAINTLSDNNTFVLGGVTYSFESSADQSTGNFFYDIEAVRYVTIS